VESDSRGRASWWSIGMSRRFGEAFVPRKRCVCTSATVGVNGRDRQATLADEHSGSVPLTAMSVSWKIWEQDTCHERRHENLGN
jgi:hypothetical protein